MATGASPSSNERLKARCRQLRQTVALTDRILLINLPQFDIRGFDRQVAVNRCYYAYPPTGLQALAQALAGWRMTVDILDLNYEFLRRANTDASFVPDRWLAPLEEYLRERNPWLVGISNFFTVDAPAFRAAAEFLKTRGSRVLVAGGQNATYNAEALVRDEVCHFVCERESENKINFLFDGLVEDRGHAAVPGIVFGFDGRVERTEGDRDVVALEGTLNDSYAAIPVEDYCRVGSLSPYSRMVGKDVPFAPILLNRGCGVGCKFCDVVDYMGRGVRSRRTGDVLDEMAYLYHERGIRHFEFLDDDFARYKDKAAEVLTGIVARGLKITWASNNGIIARTLDADLLGKMRASGCVGFKIGVESGNAEILKKIHKPGTLESFRAFARLVRAFPEMFVVDNYILGFPDETFGQMMETYHFSRTMDLDWSSFAVYQTNVNYTGDKTNRTSDRIEDFVPTKYQEQGKLAEAGTLAKGPDVFQIPADTVPSREQVKQIWTTFNLVRNFILNKNLYPGGRPEKFIRWTAAVQERYPSHPYLNLFLALALALVDDVRGAADQFDRMRVNLADPYWAGMFEDFHLSDIAAVLPSTSRQAAETLARVRDRYESF